MNYIHLTVLISVLCAHHIYAMDSTRWYMPLHEQKLVTKITEERLVGKTDHITDMIKYAKQDNFENFCLGLGDLDTKEQELLPEFLIRNEIQNSDYIEETFRYHDLATRDDLWFVGSLLCEASRNNLNDVVAYLLDNQLMDEADSAIADAIALGNRDVVQVFKDKYPRFANENLKVFDWGSNNKKECARYVTTPLKYAQFKKQNDIVNLLKVVELKDLIN